MVNFMGCSLSFLAQDLDDSLVDLLRLAAEFLFHFLRLLLAGTEKRERDDLALAVGHGERYAAAVFVRFALGADHRGAGQPLLHRLVSMQNPGRVQPFIPGSGMDSRATKRLFDNTQKGIIMASMEKILLKKRVFKRANVAKCSNEIVKRIRRSDMDELWNYIGNIVEQNKRDGSSGMRFPPAL